MVALMVMVIDERHYQFLEIAGQDAKGNSM